MRPVFYKVRHKDSDVCKNSSSGGAFTVLSDKWLDMHEKSTVYGAVMQEDLKVEHMRADNKSLRDMMRGSKYIMSDMSGIYKQIEEDIKTEHYVLFSGTPCQVFALKSYCEKKRLNHKKYLFTIEVICHGTAKQSFFEDYISYMERKYKSKAVNCKFRAKSKPGKKQDMEIKFINGKTYNAPTTGMDLFYMMYLREYVMNEQCYRCNFAKPERYADISIADFWSKIHQRGNLEDYSLVILNTEKGQVLWDSCKIDVLWDQVSIDDVILTNFFRPTSKPKDYEEFWKVYRQEGFSGIIKYMGCTKLKFRMRYMAVWIADKTNIITLLRRYR